MLKTSTGRIANWAVSLPLDVPTEGLGLPSAAEERKEEGTEGGEGRG